MTPDGQRSAKISLDHPEPSHGPRLLAALGRCIAQTLGLTDTARLTNEFSATLELHRVHQMLTAVVQCSSLGTVVLDARDLVSLWNPAAQLLFGWSAEEVLGKPLPIVAAEKRADFQKWRQANQSGGSQVVESGAIRRDGSRFDMEIWLAPVTAAEAEGEVNATIMLIADVSGRREMEEARRQLQKRIITAQEDERRRISRELHDHLGQQLTAILLGLKSLQASEGELNHGERRSASETISRLYNLVDAAMRDSHNLAWELRPTALDDLGLEVALQRFVRQWQENSGVAADFQSLGSKGTRLSPELETTLYRIAQESLTNVARHARATRASIVLEIKDEEAVLIVEDNGIGFNAAVKEGAASRLGLTGMRERLSLVNGALEIESSHGSGTSIFAKVPR